MTTRIPNDHSLGKICPYPDCGKPILNWSNACALHCHYESRTVDKTGIPIGLCQCGCGRSTSIAPSTNTPRGWKKGEPLRYCVGHKRKAREIELECAYCHIKFTRPEYEVGNPDNHYCCDEHKLAALGHWKRPHPSQMVSCQLPSCGKKFRAYYTKFIRNRGKYCCKEHSMLDLTGFGKATTCSDGHIAESQLEYLVDEWLTDKGLTHSIHPALPWSRNKKADFLVGDTYIEVWGMLRNSRYEAAKIIKLQEYSDHHVKVLSIYRREIDSGRLPSLETLLTGE